MCPAGRGVRHWIVVKCCPPGVDNLHQINDGHELKVKFHNRNKKAVASRTHSLVIRHASVSVCPRVVLSIGIEDPRSTCQLSAFRHPDPCEHSRATDLCHQDQCFNRGLPLPGGVDLFWKAP